MPSSIGEVRPYRAERCARTNRPSSVYDVLFREAEPSHAGVDDEMCARAGRDVRDLSGGTDADLAVELHRIPRIGDRRQDQDARVDAGLSKRRGLFDARHREHGCRACERAGSDDQPVAVAVRLDDRADGDAGVRGHQTKVVLQR